MTTLDSCTLWDEYGIDDDIVVSKEGLFVARLDCALTRHNYSLSHMISLVPIFTRYCRRIFCIS